MKRNGKTSAGTQRWRCRSCGASSTRKIGNSAKTPEAFPAWLPSKDSVADLKTGGATFWRRFGWVWRIWPIAPFTGEAHDVVFLDGPRLGRIAAAIVAAAGGRVVARHLARSECAGARVAVMARVPAPAMAVCDGAPGFAKAAGAVWPGARMQRCTLHAARQARRRTTLSPRLDAGKEPLGIASRLGSAKDAGSATAWLLECNERCVNRAGFLKEHAFKDGKRAYTHGRLRKARRGLSKPVKDGAPFAFVEMGRERGGERPSANNAVGSVDSRIRDMLYQHRGLPPMHRMKAISWWCRMHAESPPPAAEILRVTPTDDDADGLFAAASGGSKREDSAPEEYGSGIVWSEFHMPAEYRR